ncbi:hypothetical protein NDU88_007449 [Pleurodeles waltl]|uniref:Uncharacterized protein n=1 Tax=Pleurodeles waltl TaxID=8319 RepID=A0AAV7P0V7_PLEWA|nr:hypothetical protein NDU88_007449 [Pleurodeles waltl]
MPGDSSGASFPDPEVLCLAPRNAETLDCVGPFIAPEEEEQEPPPHHHKTTEELTATLEGGKATKQPSLGCYDQKAARL